MEEEDKDIFDPSNEDGDGTAKTTGDAPVEETVEELKKKLSEKDEANAKLFARAKTAEGFVKQPDGTWVKKPKAEVETKPDKSNAQGVDPEELRLIAKGLSDEEIEQAKAISKGKEISLTEALKDPLFVSFQKDFKEQERKEKAKLGASKGSGQEESEDFKPGMTTEEHRAQWDKTVGKK